MANPSYAESSAIESEDGRYRYRLRRRWDDRPVTVWVMLNPSTADATKDDPTIRRCVGFARSWGFGGIDVLNIFPWRATDPRALVEAAKHFDVEDRAERDRAFERALNECGTAPIAAWGAHKMARLEPVASILPFAPRWLTLGQTRGGAPRHPLYLSGSLVPVEWLRATERRPNGTWSYRHLEPRRG